VPIPYRKEARPSYALAWELDQQLLAEAEREDGVFPLLTNGRAFDAEQVLRAYKCQPLIEKRFSPQTQHHAHPHNQMPPQQNLWVICVSKMGVRVEKTRILTVLL
jgi:hypothetical protein